MPRPPRPFALRLAAYAAASILLGSALWIGRTFGDVSLDQVLWHLRYAEATAVHVSTVFLVEFLVEALLIPGTLALVAALVHTLVAARLAGWPRRLLRGVPGAICACAAGVLVAQFSLVTYAQAYWGPDRFAESYVEPRNVRLVTQARRNLVVIYVESLEATYEDVDLFGTDLLAPLRQVGGRSYGNYRPLPGMNWTMEGIVSTQCGLPLKVYAEADVRPRAGAKSFLPGATCLGDLLEARGYRNVFMGGAPLAFAGKGRFLRDHGYHEVWGREEWKRAGAHDADMNLWGLNDAALFERARIRLAQLHAAGEPFNLTLLTVDTHHPAGLMSKACRNRGGAGFPGILHCTVEHVAGFLQFARQQGYLQDTAIVVIGDHLAVDNPLIETLEEAGPRRRIFNLIAGDKLPPANTDEIIAFDLFPTLLELTGTYVPGDRLALGYSAVGPQEAVRPAGWVDNWSLAALAGSTRYDALWRADVAGSLDPEDHGDGLLKWDDAGEEGHGRQQPGAAGG